MKTLFRSLFIVTIFVLACMSCHKDKGGSTTVTGGGTYSSVSDFISRNGAPVQAFSFNASSGGTFTGAQGTVFTFYSGSLLNAAGQPVTGMVNVGLREIYTNADMIFSNKTTVANGNIPLLSGGEYSLVLTQNGQPLHMAPYSTYTAIMPSNPSLAAAAVYVWSAPDTTVNDAHWVAANDSANGISSIGDSSVLYTDSITWINCDGVFPDPSGSYCMITANPVNCPNVSQTMVYVFVNGHHAVWPLSGNGSQFNTPQDIVPNIPLTIVGYCVSGGKVYSAFTPVTATGNTTINLNFALTTDTLFKAQVRALN